MPLFHFGDIDGISGRAEISDILDYFQNILVGFSVTEGFFGWFFHYVCNLLAKSGAVSFNWQLDFQKHFE